MTTILLTIKVIALIMAVLLPLGGPKTKKKGYSIELGKWAVNENGYLENFVKTESGNY
ncbi:MAG: hypothetical protein ABI203_04470 [Mucilaginibacter sp.]